MPSLRLWPERQPNGLSPRRSPGLPVGLPVRAAKAAEPVAKPAKPAKAAKPAKTYDGPYAVKVQFSKTGGLLMHGGARVFYRPEGTEAEQIAWLEHNGLDGALYVGLVKSPKHFNVWLTYAESKANRS